MARQGHMSIQVSDDLMIFFTISYTVPYLLVLLTVVVLISDPSSVNTTWYDSKFVVDEGAIHSTNNDLEFDVLTTMVSGGSPK